jgi:hypothetical protein
MNDTDAKLLSDLRASSEAQEWAQSYPDLQAAWEACQRGDWMIGLLRALGYDNLRHWQLIAVRCARLCWEHMKDPRSRKCVEVVEAYLRGEATIEEVQEARVAAWAAADAEATAIRKQEADIIREYVPEIGPVVAIYRDKEGF